MRGDHHEESNDCPESSELSALILGKLAPERADWLFDHLHDCPQCSARVRELDGLADSVIDQLRDVRQLAYDRERGLRELMDEMPQLIDECFDTSIGQGHSSDRQEPPTAPPSSFRDYLLREKIGFGGMGAVYRGWHRRLKREVAIKVLRVTGESGPAAEHRFMREVEASGQVVHPLIVHATDAGTVGDWHYLVMEYVDGLNLSQIVARAGPLSIADAVAVIRQVALGLDFAHLKGLVHRDVKPSNIMVDRDGCVKILDLSLVRLRQRWEETGNEPTSPSPGANSETSCGRVMGTADYMSPEQSTDFRHADNRADIYSLGVTLYRLLTGRVPFPRDTLEGKLRAHREDPPPDLQMVRPDTPVELRRVFERMLAKDPADRFSTMLEVVEAIDQCPLPATPITTPTVRQAEPSEQESQQAHELLVALRLRSSTGDAGSKIVVPQRSRRRVVWVSGSLVMASIVILVFSAVLGLRNRNEGRDPNRVVAAEELSSNSPTLTILTRTTDIRGLQWTVGFDADRQLPTLLVHVSDRALAYELTEPRKRIDGATLSKADWVIPVGVDPAEAMDLSPDGKLLMVAGGGDQVHFLRLPVEPLFDVSGYQSGLTSAEVDWQGHRLYVGTLGGQLAWRQFDSNRWDHPRDPVKSDWQAIETRDHVGQAIHDIHVSVDGRWLAVIKNRVEVYDTVEQSWLSTARGVEDSRGPDSEPSQWLTAEFVDGRDRLAIAGPQYLQLWDLDRDTGQVSIQARQSFGSSVITAMDLDPASSLVALGFRDGTVVVWDLKSDQLVKRMAVGSDAISQVALSQNSRLLAAANESGVIEIYELSIAVASP